VRKVVNRYTPDVTHFVWVSIWCHMLVEECRLRGAG